MIKAEACMPMTLEEMRLSVCAKLPELYEVVKDHPSQHQFVRHLVGEKGGMPVHWPTEGLQVCHEARALFSLAEKVDYLNAMRRVVLVRRLKTVSDFDVTQASQSEQLEGISRVWLPERFE